MKDTHVLCVVCSLAVFAIVCVFIGYATDTLPEQTQRVITISSQSQQETVTQTVPVSREKTDLKKKDCACCNENMEKLKAHILQQKASEDTAARQHMPLSESQ